MTGLLVVLGAMVGAPMRHLTDHWISTRHDSIFPWGTLVVNVTGSALLGFLAVGVDKSAVSSSAMTMVGVGLCGALTTYSTFSYETVRLWREHATRYAVINIVATVVACLVGAGAGALAALAIWA